LRRFQQRSGAGGVHLVQKPLGTVVGFEQTLELVSDGRFNRARTKKALTRVRRELDSLGEKPFDLPPSIR
jgi:hypothetical protein